MEKDTKIDTELIKKLSNAQTLISVGDRKIILNEMSIGRTRDFGIQLVMAVDALTEASGKDITEMEVSEMLTKYGDILFNRLTNILNWIFSYRNGDYLPLEKEWVEENISIRIITEIVGEIARQNNLTWLLPFFRDRFQIALKAMKG